MEAKIERTFLDDEVLRCEFSINGADDSVDAYLLDCFEKSIRDLLAIINTNPPDAYLEKLLKSIQDNIDNAKKVEDENN